MGQLVTAAYDTAEGQEYIGYLAHVLSECHRLLAEGRLPDNETVASFLDDAQRILEQIRRDVAEATARSQRTVVSHVPMTAAEHARMVTMSESLKNLLEILEFRSAVELRRTDAVGRVAEAVSGGAFVP